MVKAGLEAALAEVWRKEGIRVRFASGQISTQKCHPDDGLQENDQRALQ
jgi:hypothetical protein